MYGRHHRWQTGPLDELATLQSHTEVAAEQRLRGGGAQEHEEVGLHHRDLGIEPGATGVDLGGIGLLVQATLALWLPFEVLDGVGDIDAAAIDPRLLERLVEDTSGGADERFAFLVLAIARLLSDEHDLGVLGAFAEDGLGAGLVEVAGPAAGGRLAQRLER